jgi:23S rRNA pseudouridine2605 synthase
VEKVYEVTATGDFTDDTLEKLAAGVELEDGHVTRPVRISQVRKTAGGVRFLLALKEGHKRQVRQMLKAVGGRVAELVRVSFGGLTVEGMQEGAWRILKRDEVKRLKAGGGAPAAKDKSGRAGPQAARTRGRKSAAEEGGSEGRQRRSGRAGAAAGRPATHKAAGRKPKAGTGRSGGGKRK